MDHDDWRVTISFPGKVQAQRAKILFPPYKVTGEARRRLGCTIAVGASGTQVFLYAGTEIAAREAERIARDVLAQHHLQAGFTLHRWHPAEERWEDPEVAMPRTEAERQMEHQRLLDDETAGSLAAGAAQWQARAQFRSPHEAAALAGKLRMDGRVVVRRWKYLVVEAGNEDEAQHIAGQIRREAPAGTVVWAGHSPDYLPFAGFLPCACAPGQGSRSRSGPPRSSKHGPWSLAPPPRRAGWWCHQDRMVGTMAEDRIPELETQIGQLRAQQAELRKQLIKARIEYWQGRVDDLEVQLHTGAVETSQKLTAKMDQLRRTWADTKKQWEAAATTAASAGDTVRTGLESAYRELRQALLEAKNKLASARS
jgi:outer membrane murein-binding lipoprotein Lpp